MHWSSYEFMIDDTFGLCAIKDHTRACNRLTFLIHGYNFGCEIFFNVLFGLPENRTDACFVN